MINLPRQRAMTCGPGWRSLAVTFRSLRSSGLDPSMPIRYQQSGAYITLPTLRRHSFPPKAANPHPPFVQPTNSRASLQHPIRLSSLPISLLQVSLKMQARS